MQQNSDFRLTGNEYGHMNLSMAIPKIKSTYSLDVETVETLERIAQRWRVSKSEALRRAIHAVAGGGTLSVPGIDTLDGLQKSLDLSAADTRKWSESARAERRAGSRRSEGSDR